MQGTYFYCIHTLIIFQVYFLIASSYHFERCELAKELVNHGIPRSQINDCKFNILKNVARIVVLYNRYNNRDHFTLIF